ncbi:MAG: DNA polymerase III subunit gamma/tau [Desulfobacterales bacterium]|nr:DNA polymerase III subunit gamma/tau [Desulfobacterales bacterium]
MSYLVLARKYRPQTFAEVVQQDHITRTLTNAISAGRMVHAVLFSGPRGTGKTTVARILAKAMNCEKGPTPVPCNSCRSCREITAGSAVDVYEIDGASNNSVDQIRDLRENIRYMPAHSQYKVYIIDEVHMLSIAAFNALLKTLEEPPAHVMFIFATTEPQKIPVTILSRCQRHDFRRISIDSMTRHMEMISGKEGIPMPSESVWLVAREAGGSMRDALSLLDQVMACCGAAVTHEQVLEILGIMDRKIIFDISKAFFHQDVPAVLEIIDETYAKGHDMKRLFAEIVEHARNMLIVKMGRNVDKLVDLPAHELDRIKDQVKDISVIFLNQVFDLLFREEVSVKLSTQPKLALEMVMIKLFQAKPVLPIEELILKLDALQKTVQSTPPLKSAGPDEGPVTPPLKKSRPAASESPAVAEQTKPFGGGPGAEDKDLASSWEKIVDIISEESPALASNLANSALKTLTDGTLEIEVNGNGFNINMIKRKKNMAILYKVVSDYFGKEKKITVTGRAISGNHNNEKKDTENRQKQAALNHPLVADAIEIFNGKLIDVKIR